jgi:ABC-type phosphate transport system permease subunit
VAVALLLALMVVPPLVVSMRERGCREPAEHREASLVRRAFPSTKRFYFD